MAAVGARRPVHGLQFNGKQGGGSTMEPPNLRCPRNGKQTSQDSILLRFHPTSHWSP